jgi:pilus assembly protein Flp/PilA
MLAKMYDHILRHVDSDTGATAVEYSLLLGLIAAVIVVVVTTLGTQVNAPLVTFSNAL